MADTDALDTQAVDAQQQSPADSTATQADAGETLSLEEARKLRRENATLRKRKTELETRLTQHEQAGLSELEKAQRRIAELEAAQAQAAEDRKALAVERLLADARYPDLLLAKVDLADVDVGDDGRVRGGDRLVARLRDAYPALWAAPGPGSGDGGAAGATSATFNMNDYLRRQLARR